MSRKVHESVLEVLEVRGSSQLGITGLLDNDNLVMFFKSPVVLHKQLFRESFF